MPIWVHYLSDPWPFPAADQRRRLGGKGASLRCLREAGLIVPPGFTITTDAVREFLANGHWPVGVEAEVAAAFERLRVDAAAGRSTEFDSARPLTVAVRSGAETSHPGLMRTILHCGWTETLARQVNSAEAWTEFADFLLAIRPDLDPSSRLNSVELCARLLEQFRQRGPIRDEPHFWLWEAIKLVAESSRSLPQSDGDAAPCTAVTVQAMFPAEVSGVLFSRDPLEPQAAHLVIEAVSGGGQRLMSGEVSPWSCRLDRLTLRPLVEAQVSQPSLRPAGLSEQHLEAIARAALRMETEFAGNPVDLEWGCASGRVVYFQVRPLPLASNQESDTKQQFGTVHCSPTLGGSVDSCDLSESSRPQGSGLHLPGNVGAQPRESDRSQFTFEQVEEFRLRTFADDGRPLWVRHQLVESLPHPTPLSWSVWEQFLSPTGGLGTLYRQLGFAPRRFADGQGILQLIAGRAYADPDRLPQMICGSFPLRYSHQRLIESADELHEPPTEFDPERLDPWFLLKLPHLAWVMSRSAWRIQQLRRTAGRRFHESVVPEFLNSLVDLRAIDCRRLTLRELVIHAEECRVWLFDEWLPQLMLPGWLGVQAWQAVTRGLSKLLSADEVQAVQIALLSRVSYPAHEYDLPAATGATLPFEGEFELASTSDEQPGAHLTPPNIVSEIANTELPDWPDALRQILSADRLPRLGRVIAGELKIVHRLLPLREVGKIYSRLGIALLRHILRELATRSGQGERLYFHHWHELPLIAEETTNGPTSARLNDRLAEWTFWRTRDVPQVLQAGHANPFQKSATSQNPGATETGCVARHFAARPLSPGKAVGVIWNWSQESGIAPPPGSVIVASSVDASTVLRCAAAVAFIVEQGGLLSHAAVTARFVKRPMVVLEGATSHLLVGTFAEVDGDTGAVTSRP